MPKSSSGVQEVLDTSSAGRSARSAGSEDEPPSAKSVSERSEAGVPLSGGDGEEDEVALGKLTVVKGVD